MKRTTLAAVLAALVLPAPAAACPPGEFLMCGKALTANQYPQWLSVRVPPRAAYGFEVPGQPGRLDRRVSGCVRRYRHYGLIVRTNVCLNDARRLGFTYFSETGDPVEFRLEWVPYQWFRSSGVARSDPYVERD